VPLEDVVQLGRNTLMAALIVGAPILLVATVVSVLVNIAQVLTSVQEPTISTVPRLLATAGSAILLMPWILRHLAAFTVSVFSDFRPLLK